MTARQTSLGFLLASAILVILIITTLDVRSNINDFFFTSDNPDSAFLIQQLQSDELQRRIVLSIGHPGINREKVFDFMEQFQSSLKNLKGIEKVWSGQLDEAQIRQLLSLYSKHKIHLYSRHPEDIPLLFSPDHLQARAEKIKAALYGPDPSLVKNLIREDPMLLTLDWLQHVQSSFNQSGNNHDYSALFVDTTISGMRSREQESVQQQIISAFITLNKKYNQKFTLQQTGVPVFASHIKTQVSRDIQRVSIFSTTAIFLLFILVFRSLKALILTSIVLLTTVSAAILITQLTFGFIHGLTLALGTTLIGICIDYFIHAMVHGSHGIQANRRTEAIQKIWPSLILGGSTTIFGYIALGASGFPGLQQIAIFATSGIIVALLITRFILPHFMAWLNLSLQPRLQSEGLMIGIGSLRIRGLLLVGIMVCFAASIPHINWSTSLNTLSPNLENLKNNDRIIRARMTSIEPGRFLLTEAVDMETALQRHETLLDALDQLKIKGLVDRYFPVFPWIASKQRQAQNEENWNTAITTSHLAEWKQALNHAGLSASAFPAILPQHQQPLEVAQLVTTPAWELLSRQLLQNRKSAVVVTWLGKHDIDAVKKAIQPVQGARYFSQKESLDTITQHYQQRAMRMLLWGLIAILALLLWRFKSMVQAVRILLPALFAILFVLGLNGLTGQPLNMLHLIGMLLVAAISVDYGIFFTENRNQNQTLTFQAITISAITSSASFACLGLAENPALDALAWTVAPGILIGWLLCPVILQPWAQQNNKQ